MYAGWKGPHSAVDGEGRDRRDSRKLVIAATATTAWKGLKVIYLASYLSLLASLSSCHKIAFTR